jgi:hypothetical protein
MDLMHSQELLFARWGGDDGEAKQFVTLGVGTDERLDDTGGGASVRECVKSDNADRRV